MLIAQITDLHLGFAPGGADEANALRLDRVVARLRGGPNRPDVVLATGDLTDRGDAAGYARVRAAVSGIAVPFHPMVGNHDIRATFARAFPDVALADGFVQYCVMLDGLRLVVLDTLETGRHGGGFCATRAAWLAARLAEDRTTPTVVAMHHPPFASGIAWMDPDPAEPWIGRFAAAIAGHDQIVAIWCGHLHRAIVTRWHGMTVSVCPSVAPPLVLDLRPIEPAAPDDRAMVCAGPPGLALHRWDGDALTSLFETVEEQETLARFDRHMAPLVGELFDERSRPGR